MFNQNREGIYSSLNITVQNSTQHITYADEHMNNFLIFRNHICIIHKIEFVFFMFMFTNTQEGGRGVVEGEGLEYYGGCRQRKILK